MPGWIENNILLILTFAVLAYYLHQTYTENASLSETVKHIADKQEQQSIVIANLERKLADFSISKKNLEDANSKIKELSSDVRILRGQLDETKSKKRSTEELTLKTKLLSVDLDGLKKSVTDMDSKVTHVDNKLKALSMEDDTFRRKVRDFQDEIDNMRRAQRESNPFFDTISRFFSWFGNRARHLLT